MDLSRRIQKYSGPGPRYTSYPTAPQWVDTLGTSAYETQLKKGSEGPLALYVHIPFCESLCYYCGCNIQITKQHEKENPYVNALIRELDQVASLLPNRRELSQISWGGGTPTFLAPSEMIRLYRAIEARFDIAADAEVSIEVDPRVTTDEHLKTLAALGFNRVSLGVQDFNPAVQKAVNRVQSKESTAKMLARCRELNFKGINFDLIYGLPYQTVESFQETIEQVIAVGPDRIALYNYAHLPSLRPHQKILEKMPMPNAQARIEIFNLAYNRLVESRYQAIGMDHFALTHDEMSKALDKGQLYRNFMGYTVKKGNELIGIGASAIGELNDGYFQNIRETKQYQQSVMEKGLATFRGCALTDDDRERKWIIQSLMCRFQLSMDEFDTNFPRKFETDFAAELTQLQGFYDDGILTRDGRTLFVTDLGRLFIRNVAMIFDAYLKAPPGLATGQSATYSQTV